MRLLVITEEVPSEFSAKGHDAQIMGRYYNPEGLFDEVALIDWGTGEVWKELPHKVLKLKPDMQFASWLQSVQLLNRTDIATQSELQTGFNGIPESWLATIQQFNPDVIRCYGTRWSAVLAVALRNELKCKLLCSVHNTSELSSQLLNRADQIMAVSSAVSEVLASQCGVPEDQITVVPNRVDTSVFNPRGVADNTMPSGDPRLLIVARDVEQKNITRLLEACELLTSQYPKLQLVHIGTSTRDWSAFAFATHIESVPNTGLVNWFAWADCFVLPSLWEGFGIVLIEALACGCPVVTSNRAPMSDIIVDGKTGAAVDPEDSNSIANGIQNILGQRDAMLEACIASVSKYRVEVVEAAECQLYKKTLASEDSNNSGAIIFELDYRQLGRLAGAQKTNGLTGDSMLTALRMLVKAPFKVAGYRAMLRSLLPMSILKAKRSGG